VILTHNLRILYVFIVQMLGHLSSQAGEIVLADCDVLTATARGVERVAHARYGMSAPGFGEAVSSWERKINIHPVGALTARDPGGYD
jgi:hypothetical protein